MFNKGKSKVYFILFLGGEVDKWWLIRVYWEKCFRELRLDRGGLNIV